MLDYRMEIIFKGEYLEVQLNGQDSYAVSLDLMHRIVEACKEHSCLKTLAISQMLPVSAVEAFNIHDVFRQIDITPEHKLAWVDLNPKTRESTKITESAIISRDLMNARLFDKESKALQWLMDK